MDVAISGDRGSCLTHRLAPGMYLFAVAQGFGFVEGDPIAPVILRRLREDLERRSRRNRLRRAQTAPRGLAPSLLAAFSRINADVHERTASHDDFVTAGCSLTGVLLVDDRAYLAHVGSTAAFLSRQGEMVPLTKNDTFDDAGLPVLTRALGAAPSVDVAVCSFSLHDGDALVLAGSRVRDAQEQMLVVHYSPSESAEVPAASEAHSLQQFVTGVAATIVFYALLCIR